LIELHFNKLSNAELERLAVLAEECGEVIQIVNKTIRHGFDNSHEKYGNKTCRELLEQEIADLFVIIELMLREEDINDDRVYSCKTLKKNKINRSLRYNKVLE
jgi:NTP pyrophosphatase (non-canonical NTP hydrolase)